MNLSNNLLVQILKPFTLNTSALRNVTIIRTPAQECWSLENQYDFPSWRHWMGQNWTISLYISIVYLISIFAGQRWMQNRQPFNLRVVELLWNCALGTFCFLGVYRAFPEIYRIFNLPDGVHRTFCICNQHETKTAFWGLMNVFSRVAELFGTSFIILRKKPLIFLHYYHHIAVLQYCFYYFQAYSVTLRIFGIVNSAVHGLVYLYFFLKGLGLKMPRRLPMFLTSVQLSEMMFGIFVNLYNLNMKNRGIHCDREYADIYANLTLYATFFILFAKLFRDSYLVKKKSKKEE